MLNEPQLDPDLTSVPPGSEPRRWTQENLAYLENRLIGSVRSAVGDRAEVSLKFYAYPLSSQGAGEFRASGLDQAQLAFLCNDVLPNRLLGFDTYETLRGANRYLIDDELQTYRAQCRTNQRFFAAELNFIDEYRRPVNTGLDRYAAWAQALTTASNSLVGASVFCWNCGEGKAGLRLQDAERSAFVAAFRSVVGDDAVSCDPAPGCPAGQEPCMDGCTDLRTDRRHCGGCGRACRAPAQLLTTRALPARAGTCAMALRVSTMSFACLARSL